MASVLTNRLPRPELLPRQLAQALRLRSTPPPRVASRSRSGSRGSMAKRESVWAWATSVWPQDRQLLPPSVERVVHHASPMAYNLSPSLGATKTRLALHGRDTPSSQVSPPSKVRATWSLPFQETRISAPGRCGWAVTPSGCSSGAARFSQLAPSSRATRTRPCEYRYHAVPSASNSRPHPSLLIGSQ